MNVRMFEIDTTVDAYSERQAIYLGWLLHRDEAYVLDDVVQWDHAEAHEIEPIAREEGQS
jgi:hypothetical protein